MATEISQQRVQTQRHTSFFLSSGAPDAAPIIFCHGWPETSSCWRRQLPAMAKLGFRALAPDMRGFGQSSAPAQTEDYAVRETEADMIELLDHVGAEQAIWVGHDWGAPVIWSIAQHHPERCRGVVGLCVPYLPNGFTLPEITKYVDRALYPEEQFPVGQWDYWLYNRSEPELCRKAFEADVGATIRALYRSADPEAVKTPAFTAFVQSMGGWFGPDGAGAPDMPLDTKVLSEEEAAELIAAFETTGFAKVDNWYRNDALNGAHAAAAKAPLLEMPVLFVHGAYDAVCYTMAGGLTGPMRTHCSRLTEEVMKCGHWLAQEQPDELNAILEGWLRREFGVAAT